MKLNRILALILLVTTLLCTLPVVTVSAETADDVITVIACSDFQNPGGNTAGKNTVKKILAKLVADGITSADGFLCCGDYDYEYDDTVGGINALKDAVKDVVTENMVFLKGNHDGAGSSGISDSGANDPQGGEYGVFVINESDYMWHNSAEAPIKRTAQRLTEYLNEKLEEGYTKPIFVMSHLALNYNMRTKNDGDGKHANYIFNVLNAAGAKGLNIIFLFGHNHSNGWDDYLGGSAIYLQKGDKILIAQNSQSKFKEETLNFTYMNAGYIGYYNNVNGADDTLTMTAFTISGDSVTITRYSANGTHNLKSKGVTNAYKGESGYDPDTTVYPSPQKVTLTGVTDSSPLADVIPQPQVTLSTGARFDRVTSITDIKEGKYLMVYNSTPLYVMLPKEVSKANSSGSVREGFDIEESNAIGGDVLFGDWTDSLWHFTPKGNKWLIGNGEEYIKFTYTTDKAITATLEKEGTDLSIGGGEDAFTFSGDSYTLNYNARGLINAFASNSATFTLYRFSGYSVEVEGGTAPISAMAGDTVTLNATVPEGYTFKDWTVIFGGVTLSEPQNKNASFTMPDKPVKFKAEFVKNDGTPTEWDNPYGDVAEGAWYYDSVKFVSESALMNGTAVGIFAPDVSVNRAMIVTVLYRMAGSPDVSRVETPFTDVKEGEWYADAIAWAYKNGVVNGTSLTTFSPTTDLTREQFATILYRYADEINGVDTAVPNSANLDKFSDNDEVSSWAIEAVIWTNHNGYIGGVSATLLSPKSGATRAQMATILFRYISA